MSNEVTAGARIVLELPQQLWAPFAAFRATGRFGWPGHYLVVFLAIAVVVRRFGRTAATACRRGAGPAAVRFAPSPTRSTGPPATAGIVQRRAFSVIGFRLLARGGATLHASDAVAAKHLGAAFAATDQVEPLVHLAGRHRLTINDGSAARYDHVAIGQYCERLENDMATGTVSGDTVYIMQTDYRRALFEVGREPLVCFVGHQFDMCVTLASMKRWPSDYRSGDLTLAVDHRAGTAPQPSSGSLDQTGPDSPP